MPPTQQTFRILTLSRTVGLHRYRPALQSLQTKPSHPLFHFSTTSEDDRINAPLYLHVGPSGDCWTGSSIFAAKHLQPDYVKSVLLPKEGICLETLVEVLEEDGELAQEIYDTGILPEQLIRDTKALMKEKEQDGE